MPQVATNQRDTRRGKKMVLKNCYSTAVDKLVMRYTNGQELWMQEINTALYDWCLALQRAHASAGPRGSPTFPTNRHLFMDPDSGVQKHAMTRHLQEHTQRQEDMRRRRMQTIRKDSGFLVTAKSPGFSWNEGRNEFYCVAGKFVDIPIPKVHVCSLYRWFSLY